MTLAALLEELKEVDREAFDYITTIQWGLGYSIDNPIIQAVIQGEIQRACERREWPFHVAYYPPEGANTPYYQAYIWPALKCHTAQADSAAETLLVAYIAAVREEAKR